MGDKASQKDLDERVEAELAIGQFDRTPGGRLEQLLNDPNPAVRAAIRRKLGERLKRKKAEAAEQAKKDAAYKARHGAAAPDAVDTPEAAVVDGVPTGSKVHYDDDNAVTMEKNEKYGKTSLHDGALHHERHNDNEVSEGDNKTATSKVHDVSLGKDGAGYEQRRSHEDAVGDDTSYKTSTAVGGNVGPKGVGMHVGRDAEAKLDENNKRSHGLDGSAKVGWDGKVEVEGGRKVATESERGSTEHKQTVGYGDGQIKLGSSHSETHKLDEKDDYGNQKTTSDSSSTNVRVGLDKLGADHSTSHTDKNGTTRSTSVGADIDKDGVSAHAGYSIISKGGASAHMSVSGSTKVYAEEPVQVGDHYEVQYVVTTSAQGELGGGMKGGGFSGEIHGGASESSFESGVRNFKTKEEAKKFHENAAEMVSGSFVAPDSPLGALLIPIGETRGLGSSNGLSAGGSISFDSVGVGGDVHESSTREIAIKRISGNLFHVTVVNAAEEGKDLNAHAGPISGNWGTEDTRGKSITMEFDLSTKEGQAAFQTYVRTGIPPKSGGTWMSTERTQSHEKHDNFAVTGLGKDGRKESTSEKHLETQSGSQDDFYGDQSQDLDPSRIGRFFGDKRAHYSVDVDSRMVNGKEDGYTATMKVGGESGDYNRQKMNALTFGQDGKHDSTKTSGDWTLTSSLSKKAIHELERDVPALRAAHSDQDKMRALSDMVAKYGARMLLGKGDFDVELKGDKNFPGRAGREQIENEQRTLIKSLTSEPGAAASVAQTVKQKVAALEARRAAVADTSRYTDLPDGVRADQLKLIDRELHDYDSICTNAIMQAEENKPGESADKVRAREANPHAFDKLAPEERKLAQLRDQIADKDDQLHKLYADNREAYEAVQSALSSYKTTPRNGSAVSAALSQARTLDQRADEKDTAQAALDGVIKSLRIALFEQQGADRLSAAESLAALLEAKRSAAAECLEFRKLAAQAMLNFASDESRANHARFWNQMPMPDDDDQPADDDS